MSLTRHLRRLAHRRNRERARRSARATATVSAVLVAAGTLVAVPFLVGADAATPAGSPTGAAEHMVSAPGGMRFTGWAVDPDTTDPITVYVTVDGKRPTAAAATVVANLPRPDLDATQPTADGHGFDTTVPIAAGKHTACVWAQNVGTGADTNLRCLTATFNYSPSGAVTTFSASNGALHIAGWAYDSDAPTSPVTVGIVVDGNTAKTVKVVANRSSSAALKAHPAGGANHGFAIAIPAGQGSHSVRVGFYNLGTYGSNTYNVRAGTLTLSESPVASYDSAMREGSGIRVRGWAYDPDALTTPLSVQISVDGTVRTVTANVTRSDVARSHPSAGSKHGFSTLIGGLAEGTHTVCVTAVNIGYGSDRSLGCKKVTLNFTPSAALTSVTASAVGVVTVKGWATDPDTTAAIRATVSVAGRSGTARTVTANAKATTHSGHSFTTTYSLPSGTYSVCVVGLNAGYGTHNSKSACRSVSLALSPRGSFESVKRSGDGIVVSGWAWDPDRTLGVTPSATSVVVTVDKTGYPAKAATAYRADVRNVYPGSGTARTGFSIPLPADDGEHTVCVTAVNVKGGKDASLGCKAVWATVVTAPSSPTAPKALGGYNQAGLTWTGSASDGGAPIAYYGVQAQGGKTVARATGTSYIATNLGSDTAYTFLITAYNAAGKASSTVTVSTRTLKGPAPQTSPAPISTSRYIRRISSNATASDLAWMRAAGVADAQANPSNHRYLVLLDIGGQDQYYGGVVLSATTRFVSYANLVKNVKAYVDGYASAQKGTAPVTVAIGTNNDMDVTASAGAAWADKVVDPVRTYALKYRDMAVAGANDIEPGFDAGYGATKAWLTGYLGATTADFVFNGSADGCSPSFTGRGCNNGWSSAKLYDVSQGAAPGRMVALPQIYNSTMAAQWKWISLTGVTSGKSKVVFGGALTEYTACAQAGGSCYSLGGRTAWTYMWNNLQSDARLKIGSLPYSTDLRIN